MKLESIKSLAIIGALGALALAGCSNVSKKSEPYVEIYSQRYDEKKYVEKKVGKKQSIDIRDYKEKVKEYILLPNWRRVPF